MAQKKQVGDIILGSYVIKKVFEKSALLYLIENREDKKQLIAKTVHPNMAHSGTVWAWFTREANVLMKIASESHPHPYIVSFVALAKDEADGGSPYILLEYVESKPLSDIISSGYNCISLVQTVLWGMQIAFAMKHVSENAYVHRDLEPGNNLIDKKSCWAKLNDFGLAKSISTSLFAPTINQPNLDVKVGKPYFMPPEQLLKRDYLISSDIYCWAGILSIILTGKPTNPEKINRLFQSQEILREDQIRQALTSYHKDILFPAIDQILNRLGQQSLADLIKKCLDFDPVQRVQSFSEIIQKLQSCENNIRNNNDWSKSMRQCSQCSFISSQTVSIPCPVCGQNQWKRYDISGFQFPSMDEIEHISTIEEMGTLEDKQTQTVDDKQTRKLIRIPGGDFTLGPIQEIVERVLRTYQISSDIEIMPPSKRIHFPGVLISKVCVSNEVYQQFVESTGYPNPSYWAKRSMKNIQDHPVTHISFADAEAFCQWKDVRLPTAEEWEVSARGSTNRAYPWGDVWEKDKCNSLELNRGEPVSVSDFSQGKSAYGLYQMAGNVMEWVDNGIIKDSNVMKYTMGGSYRTPGEILSLTWVKIPASEDGCFPDVGFRYAKDLESVHRTDALSTEELEELIEIPNGNFKVGYSNKEKIFFNKLHVSLRMQGDDFSFLQERLVTINRFSIRKYLVTNEEFWQFVQATGAPWPICWHKKFLDWSERPFLKKYQHHPVTVSAFGAFAFCLWKNVRLPLSDEWEVASRGTESFIFPWGDNLQENSYTKLCNTLESSQARTVSVNSYPEGKSPYGCFGMAGNVAEWTMNSNGRCMIRGSSFKKSIIYAAAFFCRPEDPNYCNQEVGFRYCV